ncbi:MULTISPECIES: XRE family transcriptional regulator [Paenibacillus]|uniref:XRE family transcriptional regulator n=1 Tax=Paenibacillus TaxID=44249 RepID=UPI001F08BDD3|nr:XRE family transcriptional regulator [Paenibacillus periandrae]
MYPNLDAEMARRGIKRKDLACLFKNRTATVSDKLNGKYPFLLDEAFRIKETYFPDMPLDYLFKQTNQNTS